MEVFAPALTVRGPSVNGRRWRPQQPPPYNADENEMNLSLFRGQLGSASGATPKTLQHEEWRTIMMYVLTNLSEIEPYIE